VLSTAWIIYVQGKTHCGYHFIPLKWALALGGGLLSAGVTMRAPPRWFEWLWVAVWFASVQPFVRHASKEMFPSTEPMARELEAALGPSETIVLFGFTPSLLWRLERTTPFPYVDSAIMYAGAGNDTPFQHRILSDWRRALEHRDVRFFLVERDESSALSTGIPSKTIAARQFPETALAELGFTQTTRFRESARWDVYERLP
jgi:hypothetical protein